MKANRTTSLILLISGLIELAIIGFLILPQVNNLSNRQSEIDANSEELKATQEKYNALVSLVNNTKEADNLTSTLNVLLPDNPEQSSFMLELDFLAKSSNLQIPTITIDTATPKAAPPKEEPITRSILFNKARASETSIETSSIGYQTSVSGKYEDFLDFLCKLESSKRFNTLPALSLSPQEGNVTVALSGNIYYLNSDVENANFDINNLNAIKTLVEYKKFITPSSVGSDGRDNPFAPIQ